MIIIVHAFLCRFHCNYYLIHNKISYYTSYFDIIHMVIDMFYQVSKVLADICIRKEWIDKRIETGIYAIEKRIIITYFVFRESLFYISGILFFN